MSKKQNAVEKGTGNSILDQVFNLRSKSREIKARKKEIQFACPHKDKKGHLRLKNTDGRYMFKCTICKDKKVDLSILNKKNGTPAEQLANAFKTLKSMADLMKLQASNKDERAIDFLTKQLGGTYRLYKVMKKFTKANTRRKAKFSNEYGLSVGYNGKTLHRH